MANFLIVAIFYNCLFRATITNLQTRLDATVTSNTLMKEELTLTKQALAKVLDENTILKGSNSSIFLSTLKSICALFLINSFVLAI